MADIIDYNSDLEYLLKIHAEECESFSILHRYSFEKYSERSNYINIPVIILSSAIGFATGIDIGYDKMNIILGVSSIFVGIIKSIDTYFQLGKRSESHRICSLQFQQINKKIMIELSLKRDQRISAKDMLQIIKTDIKNLQDIAPLIDEAIIETFKKNYGILDPSSNKIKFSAHTPNLCNGLSQVAINGDKSNDDGEGRGRRRRRSNSRGSRGSRGSSGYSHDSDDDNSDGDNHNGGGHSRGSKRNDKKRPSDGNASSGSASSGFINSVSNLFHKGVNLIKGTTPPPPPSDSDANNKNKRSNTSSRNSSRNNHDRNKNSVIELTSVVVDGANNNELQDIINNKMSSSNNTVTSVKSTPSAISNNNSNNATSGLLLTESHVQQLQLLHQLQQQQQGQGQQQQQQQQLLQQQPPSRSASINSHHSHHSHHSHPSQHSHQSFNPVNFTNTITAPSLVASAEFIFNNNNLAHPHPPTPTPGTNSQHPSKPSSLAGSTHNSVMGAYTPRNINELDNNNNNNNASNQVIEIHEIDSSIPAASFENLSSNINLNLNSNPNINPDDDSGALM